MVLKNLENLKYLDMSELITDDGIMHLTNLISLYTNMITTNNGITKLTNLTYLKINSSHIDDHGISNLKNLEELRMGRHNSITLKGLQLPKLIAITIYWDQINLINNISTFKYLNVVFTDCPFKIQIETVELIREERFKFIKVCEYSSTVTFQNNNI